jgi:hypothetical protein
MLGVGVSANSWIFREQLHGSKPIALRMSLYHWKAIETYMSKMGLHDPFGHLKHKLWSKERPEVKLPIWLLTIRSQESTRFPYVQVVCDMKLESSWWGLQLWFKPRPGWRLAQEVIVPQSRGSSILSNFGTPIWESWDKKPFGWGRCVEVQSILYGGRLWLPLSLGRGESCKSKIARGSS